ncbi:WD repeat-containing protein 36-like isoform X1 [Zingiber officinale]|uniref:WD repeat-containing protein 36-like isoform X1 n=2 Tax=Zingiber officinale TaxID=94328 RepID=UPI001C4B3AA7|nr:WD repeat-containing protein 36-like isoform X1 [Zingiber officinale]XP_042436739.1 WD repeat-containing protein 36-like isoform X1 [Zingiber officinale]XP_042436740.1 WD repeat-containing protein 36-like isoform X1 [Zingiber officinale]
MGIFEPYRAIGYITTNVPFSVQRLGTETFVTVSVGKAWRTYNCAKLTLFLGGPQLPKKIRALASCKDFTIAAYGNDIGIFKRAHQVATWSRHQDKVNLLLVFGDHVLSVDIKGNLFIWSLRGDELNLEPVGHILLDDKFTPSCIMHPDTYLNKIIIGSQEGQLQLWNVNTKKKLFDFKGWNSSVCCCVASPALDVVAIGCSDGTIHVHNVRYDEEIVSFTHSMRGAVTALSFRTDGQPFLASGGSSGVISIWNLEKRRLQSVIREAHDGTIISLHFFANEPVLMSSSADNSIKMWIFDTTDGDARLLRFRSGHSAPPLCIRFYGNGRYILSAGQDRAFRLFSIIQEQQSRELSQRHVTKRAKKLRTREEEIKLKPVITFDFAEIRERDWCNVVTCHMDTPQAYVWRLQNFVIGEHILSPSADIQTPIKACAISACGNFAILGTNGGWIERFNLQSGISRGTYVDISESRQYAHDGEVVGIACDATNSSMISAGYNGDIKVWDFKGRELQSSWNVGKHIIKLVYHRTNGLLATVAEDMVIRLYDVVALRMVRKFEGHNDRITDLCFSDDGKWLLSSSMDGTLRVWDVILAKQIDAISVGIPITALSLSPLMDVLVTSHVDQNGIYLWVNQAMFSGVSKMDSYALGSQVRSVEMPTVASNGGANKEETLSAENVDAIHNAYTIPQLDKQMPNLITLSLLPRSQWQSLTNLDIIKVRNKPIEPPKKPEKAPFFLPSVPTLSGQILFEPNSEGTAGKDKENMKNKKGMPLSSHFILLLNSCAETKNFSAFTDYIKGLSPSDLDLELRILQIVDEDNLEKLDQRQPELQSIGILLDYLIHELSSRNNFELIQAVIKLFLKIHGETLRHHSLLQEKAKRLLEVQSTVWQRIDKMFQSARCMVTFLSNSQF